MGEVDVVVIDDDDSVRWVFQEILTAGKIPHLTAGSGPEGLELVYKSEPTLVIVDLKLGAMSGLDVARRIMDSGKKTKILFVTGYLDTITAGIIRDLHPVGIIKKPFQVRELLKTVHAALGNK